MLDKSYSNSSEKVIVKTCVDKADKNFRSSVPVPINQDIAIELVSN
jgi:hypothetical protein